MDYQIKKLYQLIAIIGLFAVGSQAEALVVNGYNPALHDRFISGTYSSGPTPNPTFIGSSYDWSGVGWQTSAHGRSVALISPQHFVAANHYKVPVGETVTFYNGIGELKTYEVAGYTTFPEVREADGYTNIPDLVVGRLQQAVTESDDITYYSVLDADDYTTGHYDTGWYVGKDIYAYGRTARAGINTIDYFQGVSTRFGLDPDNGTTTAVYDTDLNNGYVGEAGGQGGDSGSPSFIPYNGELTLMGTHFAISGSTSDSWKTYDSFVPAYLEEIDAALNPYGYQVRRISIDIFPTKLQNADFETWDSNEWRPQRWQREREVSGPMLTRNSQSTDKVKSGQKSTYIGENVFSSQGQFIHNEYYLQTVTGPKEGQQYAFSFWYLNSLEIAQEILAQQAELKILAGIDPTGGTDPGSADIIWQMVILTPGQFDSNWHQMSIMATAGNSPMTFFIGRELLGMITADDVAMGRRWSANTYIDDAQVHAVPEPSTLVLLASSLIGLLGFRKSRR